MPTAFAFSDQRFRRWIASGQSPVFIPTPSAFLFFRTFGGPISLRDYVDFMRQWQNDENRLDSKAKKV